MFNFDDFCFFFIEVLQVFEVVVWLGIFECVVEFLLIIGSVVSKWVFGFEGMFGVSLLQCDGCLLVLIFYGCEYFEQIVLIFVQFVVVLLYCCQVQCQQWLILCMLLIFVWQILILCLVFFVEVCLEIELEIFLLSFLDGQDLLLVDVEVCGDSYGVVVGEWLLEECVLLMVVLGLLFGLLWFWMLVMFVGLLLLCLLLEFWQLWFCVVGLDWLEFCVGLCLFDLGMILEVVVNGQGVVFV